MDRISALMDGELDRGESLQAIERMRGRPEEDDSWQVYHLIGDAMRNEPCCGSDLCARIAARLADEPTVLAPRRAIRERLRSFAMPALAAAAAVAAVTWVTVGSPPGAPGADQTLPAQIASRPAANPAPGAVPGALQQAVRPVSTRANIEEYLQAHRFLSPDAGASGFIGSVRPVLGTHTEPQR